MVITPLIQFPEYGVWRDMNQRCRDHWCSNYKNYGGRGIIVHPPWVGRGGFKRFIAYIGQRPTPEHSIDRTNNNGNYEPGNVRWATRNEQEQNKRPGTTGFANPQTLLNRQQVRIIKHCVEIGLIQTGLAETFKVSETTIGRAVWRKL